MFKKFSPSKMLPSGGVAFPQEESINTFADTLQRLYPRLADQQNRGRAPRANAPKIIPHPLRPQVLASERIFFWISLASLEKRRRFAIQYTRAQLLTFDNAVLHSLAEGTRSGYGSGIIDWICWCDRNSIPEERRLPISSHDLRIYFAHKVGFEGASKTNTILSGLRAWHIIQDVPWPSEDQLISNLRRAAASEAPPSTICPPRPPVTVHHLAALRQHLNLQADPFDIAVFACACTAFWGLARLGELVCPIKDHEPAQRVARSGVVSHSMSVTPSLTSAPIVIKLPWTKTTKSAGAILHLSEWDEGCTDISPTKALKYHLHISNMLPESAPLFAFQSSSPKGWTALTRNAMIKRCCAIWKLVGMDKHSGHSFRIGGTTELLLRGVSHDAVKIQGRWTSDAWLRYIRQHPELLEREYAKTRAAVLFQISP